MKNVLLAAGVLPLLLTLILPACGGEDATPTRRSASVAQQTLVPSATVVSAAESTVAVFVLPVSTEPSASTAAPTTVVSAPVLTPFGAASPATVTAAVPALMAVGGPGRLAPISVKESGSLRTSLSMGELTCVEDRGLGSALESPLLASAEEQVALMDCLDDETVLRVFLGGLTGGLEELEAETSSCVRRGTESLDLRSVTASGLRGDEESALAGTMAGLLVVSICLSEEEFAVAAPFLGMGPGDREAQACVVEALGGLEDLASVLAGGEGGMVALMGAVAFCGLSPGGLNPGG